MRIFRSIGLALAACLSMFSFTAIAENIRVADYVSGFMIAISEPQGVALARLELTLAQWRTESQAGNEALKSNMLSDRNHFVMASVLPAGVPDWDVPS